jgi:hypothetical protein
MSMNTARVALSAGALAFAASATAQELPFSDGKWELGKTGVKAERFDERDVLTFDGGIAYRRDVRLQDGTIEFDVQVSRRRSFVYVSFRMVDDENYEEFYLRPHKSGLSDSVQYAPVYQGHSAWQLHHGPGGTAAIVFEPGVWTHVRVVLQGARAALFVGPGDKPALVAPLAREPRPGYIALRGFLPQGALGTGSIARVSNVVVRPEVAGFDFASVPAPPPAAAGVIRAWSVSQSFAPPKEGATDALPGPEATGEFRRLETEPSGLLELHRHVAMPKGSPRAAAAVARLRLRASAAGPRALDLGFSDRVTVFLNGRPLFAGEASYSFDAPRREGLIELSQARVWLPLNAGENDLRLVVSDTFGGWGLMGRFADSGGLEIDAR